MIVGLFIFGAVASLAAAVWLAILHKRSQKPKDHEAIEAERIAKEKAKQEKLFFQDVRRMAMDMAKLIPHQLSYQHKMDFVEVIERKGRNTPAKKKIKPIRWKAILFNHTNVLLCIDGKNIPRGVSLYDFIDPKKRDVLEGSLTYGLSRPIRILERNWRIWIQVPLKHSDYGIPVHVSWSSVQEDIPKSYRYAFVVGKDINSKTIVCNFEDAQTPHLGVLGSTGNGKSVLMSGLVASLVFRNSPEYLNLVFLDLKRVELVLYKDLPHVRQYANTAEEGIDALQWAIDEMNRRYMAFSKLPCQNIQGWNAQKPLDRLPYIFILIDELARAMTHPTTKIRRKYEALIYDILSLGRAAGVHLVVATQSISKEVLPGRMLANIDSRICYATLNIQASTLAIGNGDAFGLGRKGQGMFLSGSDRNKLQSPYISGDEAVKVVSEVIEKYQQDEPDEGTTIADPALANALRLARDNYGGLARYQDLFKDAGIPQEKLRVALSELRYKFDGNEDKVFLLDNEPYVLVGGFKMKGVRGSVANQLFHVNGDGLPTSKESWLNIINENQKLETNIGDVDNG